MPFKGKLCVSYIEDDLWRLDAPLVYEAWNGKTIIVPKGFITDFVSVPRIPFIYSYVGNIGQPAAVVHDYLYNFCTVSRKEADQIFYEALRDCGVDFVRAKLMYWGVRIGAFWAYDCDGSVRHAIHKARNFVL